MEKKSYLRFAAMIATSTLVMFGLMYLNTYQLEHVRFSETRAWMALLMGAVMAVIMLLFMLRMYSDKRLNIAILAGSVAVFAGSLWLVRSQETVDDVAYMRAMIPHHSIAILTSERAHIRDPRVRELADGIIEAQKREIAEMDALIADLERSPTPAGTADLPPSVVK
jgi:FlaA1/EpsC-like NDP-sugar epimerase